MKFYVLLHNSYLYSTITVIQNKEALGLCNLVSDHIQKDKSESLDILSIDGRLQTLMGVFSLKHVGFVKFG